MQRFTQICQCHRSNTGLKTPVSISEREVGEYPEAGARRSLHSDHWLSSQHCYSTEAPSAAVGGQGGNSHLGLTGRPSCLTASKLGAGAQSLAALSGCSSGHAGSPFPANPAQAVVASSSLLNLPPSQPQPTAHPALPSSPGTNRKHAQVHLLGDGRAREGHLPGTHRVRAREQASFHQSKAGFPRGAPALCQSRPHSTGTICPKNTLILIHGSQTPVPLPKTDYFVKLKAGRVRPV